MAEAEPRLLMLIDDDAAHCRKVAARSARHGWRVVAVGDSASAVATLATREGLQLSAVVLDHKAGGDDACALIAELKRRRPALPILMLTTSGSPLLAVEAMRAGASDYLLKPVAADRLLEAVRVATAAGRPAHELHPLTEKMSAPADFRAMVGESPEFRQALALAADAAGTNAPVLIEGAEGTGKEMLARAIHAAGPRAGGPLRFVSLGALPSNQTESVLFGHERGAFPGAFERHVGALQHAHGGTVVLDDIDRLAPGAQERLAAFLAGGEVRPLGAARTVRVDVRVIATSGGGLAEGAGGKTCRADLVAALAAIRIALPPLRARSGDIAALTRHFLDRIGEQPGLRTLQISDGALALLNAYDWPGNVRQLQAVLFRAAVFCDGEALAEQDFPNLSRLLGRERSALPAGPAPAAMPPAVPLYEADGHLRPLEEIEADVIRLAIDHYRGRMSEVARRLGIGRSTLYRKLADLGIDNAA